MRKKTIKWLRPHEICKASGRELGNCWFLAALSNLVEDKRYLDQVIPPDQSFHSSYAGIFRFRFWRYGRWVEVVIDDRLPTRNGKLIFLRSIDSNEFWGALLEKAYAKLHGSYKALEGGLTIEAAVDFTGGIPELISIDQLSMSKERLFYLMSSADRNGAFMGAAVTKKSGFSQEAKSKGLHTSHAYTITNVVEIRSSSCSGGIPLIRIRNPHGNSKEWKGDWADGDKHWKAIPVHLREKLELEICHLTPDAAVVNFDPHATRIKRFDVFHFFGSWSNAKNTSGGCGNAGQKAFSGNPQFFLDLKDPDPYDDEIQCSIIVSLLQKNLDRANGCIAIGFKVYRCNPGTDCLKEPFLLQNLSIDRTETFMNLREISKRMFLPEGRYCIIPCPFKKGEEAEFLLRVFVLKNWGSSEQSKGKLVKATKDARHTDTHKFAEDFGSRLNTYGHRYKGDQKGMLKNATGKALNILEQHFPEGSKGLKKLKQFYNWAKDKDSEFDLLKKIIKTF
ncbi:CAPNN [Lepeophtheirus salmonis]|uniref:CAPNN n=1 Tax=Lepeophtheirus salmonis TaxID=72036 RepID=A0A7R8HCM0_LEPSM|nr:CAPNN [Lepeophtheirus salmonis]CAF3004801.1 CAPNN [Lepeophtheirus salmonis]